MARNGSGTYVLPAGQPVVTGTSISSTTFNTLTSDLANALTQSLASDGQTTPTANLPMGGYKHTGVASGTARTDYAALGQVQDSAGTWLTGVAGADTITASVSNPTLAAYAAGQIFRFVSAGANTTAVTLNINSIGAKAVTKNGATALVAGDIANGAVVSVVYDGTQFQLVNIGSSVTSSSTATLSNKTLLAAGPNTVEATAGPASSAFTLRNKLINGLFMIDQRNNSASVTVTAGAALQYTCDRWYAYCTGANVTADIVSAPSPNATRYRFTGAASVTKIALAQRIEALNCQDLAGQTATLSVDLSNTVLTTVTWTAWYANTTNTFGTLASPTRTQIATGTWTVTSTLTRYNAQISVPAAATTGIEIELSVGAQTSGTWNIGRVQFEQGGTATPFEHRPYSLELGLCCRYFYSSRTGTLGKAYSMGSAITTARIQAGQTFPTPMRTTPTTVIYSADDNVSGKVAAYNVTGIGIGTTAFTVFAPTAGGLGTYIGNTSTDLVAGNFYTFTYTADGEL